jgi:hypothetical protein
MGGMCNQGIMRFLRNGEWLTCVSRCGSPRGPYLDALKVFLDQVSFLIKFKSSPSVGGLIGARREAGKSAFELHGVSKFVRIEAFVCD